MPKNKKKGMKTVSKLHDQDLDTNYIPSRFISILFLLPADEKLWKVFENHIYATPKE